MEFPVQCPTDGQVTVGLGDVASISLRDDDMVDVVFVCPECGQEIAITAKVPHALLASWQDVATMFEAEGPAGRTFQVNVVFESAGADDAEDEKATSPAGEPPERVDRYCEYFRRQLDACDSVEAILEEIDAR